MEGVGGEEAKKATKPGAQLDTKKAQGEGSGKEGIVIGSGRGPRSWVRLAWPDSGEYCCKSLHRALGAAGAGSVGSSQETTRPLLGSEVRRVGVGCCPQRRKNL